MHFISFFFSHLPSRCRWDAQLLFSFLHEPHEWLLRLHSRTHNILIFARQNWVPNFYKEKKPRWGSGRHQEQVISPCIDRTFPKMFHALSFCCIFVNVKATTRSRLRIWCTHSYWMFHYNENLVWMLVKMKKNNVHSGEDVFFRHWLLNELSVSMAVFLCTLHRRWYGPD